MNESETICLACKGSGYTPEGEKFNKAALAFMSVSNEITSKLAGTKHSSSIQYSTRDKVVIKQKLVETAGLPKNWEQCKTCVGTGKVSIVEN